MGESLLTGLSGSLPHPARRGGGTGGSGSRQDRRSHPSRTITGRRDRPRSAKSEPIVQASAAATVRPAAGEDYW
ncbi:hypothetical protein ACFYMI_39980 [Streptomyces collinus]|uniref:hypothetical protein n=1 Tax=Streptomyces collinus TaxID=42684 RepID=UPI0036C74BBE